MKKIGAVFSISSLANAAWIFSWHYEWIPLSMVFMGVLLICLIWINREIKKVKLNEKETLFIGLPFSVYFGWITVATIANATTLLVSIGWDGFGISEATWTMIMLVAGVLIGISTMFVNKDMPYGFVLVWAYVGIFIKHTDENIFAGQYPGIINTILACIGLLLVAEAYVFFTKKDKIFRRSRMNN
jgi:FtsH-binding integral membrane protein